MDYDYEIWDFDPHRTAALKGDMIEDFLLSASLFDVWRFLCLFRDKAPPAAGTEIDALLQSLGAIVHGMEVYAQSPTPQIRRLGRLARSRPAAVWATHLAAAHYQQQLVGATQGAATFAALEEQITRIVRSTIRVAHKLREEFDRP